MTSIRKRRRQIARLAARPALDPFLNPGRWVRGVLYLPPDPKVERQDFIRQLMERRPLEPGEPEPIRGEIGTFEGIRFITSEQP
jgi:hypothetical protein